MVQTGRNLTFLLFFNITALHFKRTKQIFLFVFLDGLGGNSSRARVGQKYINSNLKMEMEPLHEMLENFHILTSLSSRDITEQRAYQRIMCACQKDSCSNRLLHPFYNSLHGV